MNYISNLTHDLLFYIFQYSSLDDIFTLASINGSFLKFNDSLQFRQIFLNRLKDCKLDTSDFTLFELGILCGNIECTPPDHTLIKQKLYVHSGTMYLNEFNLCYDNKIYIIQHGPTYPLDLTKINKYDIVQMCVIFNLECYFFLTSTGEILCENNASVDSSLMEQILTWLKSISNVGFIYADNKSLMVIDLHGKVFGLKIKSQSTEPMEISYKSPVVKCMRCLYLISSPILLGINGTAFYNNNILANIIEIINEDDLVIYLSRSGGVYIHGIHMAVDENNLSILTDIVQIKSINVNYDYGIHGRCEMIAVICLDRFGKLYACNPYPYDSQTRNLIVEFSQIIGLNANRNVWDTNGKIFTDDIIKRTMNLHGNF